MAIPARVKCPTCGEVLNIDMNMPCPKCGTPLQAYHMAEIHLYRMGSPIGVAVGYGIYINGQPMGHLGNKESLRIPLPYGTYTIHFTCGMTRKCEDATVVLTPEMPVAYIKGSIKAGFWTNKLRATVVRRDEMPAGH